MVVLQCIAQFRRLRREYRSLKAKEPGTPVVAEDIPPELTPLIQGAWIGKPSPGAPKKRRFFQLSSDGSTLRWAWDKYIVLYYVEVGAHGMLVVLRVTSPCSCPPHALLALSRWLCTLHTALEAPLQAGALYTQPLFKPHGHGAGADE